MKIILKSDFKDYYDIYFDILIDSHKEIYKTYYRISNGGMHRIEMLQYLKTIGKVVEFGVVEDFDYENRVVVYTDEKVINGCIRYSGRPSHCGENKELLTVKEAIERGYSNNICSLYSSDAEGESIRKLIIGNREFYIRYKSNDWRSNINTKEIEVISDSKLIYENRVMPIYAIDYVKDKGVLKAVDFNSAPGIRGSGVEELIKGKEVVDVIRAWYDA